MTATETLPTKTDTTTDDRKRHIVLRLTPKGVRPPKYADRALCGEKVSEVVFDHNGKICQACVDEQKKRPVEK